MTIDKSQIRNAATVIVLRDRHDDPKILMGQRGAKAAFMPNKFVFPGGAVDAEDAQIPLAAPLPDTCAARLREDADPALAHAVAVAAVRELWEETGLILGRPGTWDIEPPADWASFAATGHLPHAAPLQFVFRALTPPGRPRRFDARFFLVDAEDIASDLDDFNAACDELSHLQWVALSEARSFDMPFITEVVLAEVQARARDLAPPASVPFFKNNDEESLFLRLRGHPMTD
ncbi:NUDIX hydrolase [Sulfitobacter mediterraneus]|uniref:NUDIX hydrolase n=1 Tax=Sulfitobacter mediterraneus TaxID=83219 RepID=UPI0019345628|nr:NUDIX hydrolase [Sulfitobacter mediterraneus]MBM1311620.1 NUDIX hydrolase [Sulfitobacter mediterraneus]MBM1315502.1 NUDIX hydrolase [Sulfitobacter mediterraneus]MBM1323863.1 NUDIX hydrolase [Sulfitobacter mediterraneus]MBM1327775.1 NUDIX hydrolase [Sulfitobacter mediterraneus]MBM1399123.1 NUDIX hydrolase [Sulfitobacter mediterraneus]